MIPPRRNRPTRVARPDCAATLVLSCAGTDVATWAITDWDRQGLDIVEMLARLQLFARRLDCRIEVRDPCPELVGLLDLVGLAERLGIEVVRKTEDLEQLSVQEVVMPDDPVV
jgi:hypothetical protein